MPVGKQQLQCQSVIQNEDSFEAVVHPVCMQVARRQGLASRCTGCLWSWFTGRQGSVGGTECDPSGTVFAGENDRTWQGKTAQGSLVARSSRGRGGTVRGQACRSLPEVAKHPRGALRERPFLCSGRPVGYGGTVGAGGMRPVLPMPWPAGRHEADASRAGPALIAMVPPVKSAMTSASG